MSVSDPIVHVVMAVFNPQPHHLEAQLGSLSRQAGVTVRLHAVISDLVSGDAVFTTARKHGVSVELLTPPRKTGAVEAFEFGLKEALAASGDGDYFALCDQDDIWSDTKLSRSVSALRATPDAHLVHTDARLVDDDGQLLHPSMFAHENRDHLTGLRRLLYRNSITGMTAVFSRDVVTHALPFPRQSGTFFYHDLWLGLIAGAKGPIVCLREATVDYRQHDKNVVGAVNGSGRLRTLSKPWLRARFASFSLACYLAKSLVLRAEQIMISEPAAFDQARLGKLRPYLRHLGVGGSFFLDAAGYKIRGYGELADHSFSQGVVKAGRMAWAAQRMLKLDFRNRLKEFDDVGYSLAPGNAPAQGTQNAHATHSGGQVPQPWFSFLDERKTMRWSVDVSVSRPAACTILVPTLNPTEIFAGIATALDLGIGLARRGMRVRFVATDLPMICPHASKNFLGDRLESQERRETLERIELACGVTEKTLEFSPFDSVVATAWWSAHVAKTVMSHPGISGEKFFYLVQDFEPNFYAWGTDFAGAMESYDMACIPIFNTTLLRDYFVQMGFAFGGQTGFAFRPSIDINQYASLNRATGRQKWRIAVYGRPEVPRNMFPVCVEALAELVVSQNLTPDSAEIVSVGLAHEPINLPNGMTVQSLGKLPMDEYPIFLTTVDIGLSLMYSPHPSHPPIEMAASGARVVTNNFGPKDLSRLSPLIQSVDPTPEKIAKALAQAWVDLGAAIPVGARHIDLSSLGQELDEVAGDLFSVLAIGNAKKRVA